MDIALLKKRSEFEWHIPAAGKMRVPGIIFADRRLLEDMDHQVYKQVRNVAQLPGIVTASFAMPDAHWGCVRASADPAGVLCCGRMLSLVRPDRGRRSRPYFEASCR